MRLHGLVATLSLVALVAVACGRDPAGPNGPTSSPTPSGPGDIAVNYQFQGAENPNRVNVYLIDGSTGMTCQSLPYTPTQNIEAQQNNLPPNGSAGFGQLADGDKWLIWAVGFRGNNIRVADACRDFVTVRAGQTTDVPITLENRPLAVAGNYDTELKLNLEMPTDVVNTLLMLDAACQLLNLDPQVCDITSQVLDIMIDLDVEATWVLTQNAGGEIVDGEMVWTTVEGADVGQWNLVSGGFTAEIPGATQLQFKAHNLEIKVDKLVEFILVEVMEVDLGALGTGVVGIVLDYLADELVSDITIHDANGSAIDADVNGLAESINGQMDAEISFPAFSYTHDFAMNWDAKRQN